MKKKIENKSIPNLCPNGSKGSDEIEFDGSKLGYYECSFSIPDEKNNMKILFQININTHDIQSISRWNNTNGTEVSYIFDSEANEPYAYQDLRDESFIQFSEF